MSEAATPDVRPVVGDADLVLSLTVGPLPEDVDADVLVQTGLKWPDQ